MIKTITEQQFHDAFISMGRENQFSYHGRKALYDYLEELAEETGKEAELDVVALCCEFVEYDNIEELQEEMEDIETMEELQDKTLVIDIPEMTGFIIQQF